MAYRSHGRLLHCGHPSRLEACCAGDECHSADMVQRRGYGSCAARSGTQIKRLTCSRASKGKYALFVCQAPCATKASEPVTELPLREQTNIQESSLGTIN